MNTNLDKLTNALISMYGGGNDIKSVAERTLHTFIELAITSDYSFSDLYTELNFLLLVAENIIENEEI